MDGSLTLEKRGSVLLEFKRDPNIKVLLLTYASGSTGYVGPVDPFKFAEANQWHKLKG